MVQLLDLAEAGSGVPHLHRFGEQAFLPFQLVAGGGPYRDSETRLLVTLGSSRATRLSMRLLMVDYTL